jgi:hypothetical protein
MDQARPTRKLLDWKPVGTRPIGWPRQRWQEDVMEDLRKLKVKNWKETAKKNLERPDWEGENPQRIVVPNDWLIDWLIEPLDGWVLEPVWTFWNREKSNSTRSLITLLIKLTWSYRLERRWLWFLSDEMPPFYPERGDSRFLWNVDIYTPDFMVSHSRKYCSKLACYFCVVAEIQYLVQKHTYRPDEVCRAESFGKSLRASSGRAVPRLLQSPKFHYRADELCRQANWYQLYVFKLRWDWVCFKIWQPLLSCTLNSFTSPPLKATKQLIICCSEPT